MGDLPLSWGGAVWDQLLLKKLAPLKECWTEKLITSLFNFPFSLPQHRTRTSQPKYSTKHANSNLCLFVFRANLNVALVTATSRRQGNKQTIISCFFITIDRATLMPQIKEMGSKEGVKMVTGDFELFLMPFHAPKHQLKRIQNNRRKIMAARKIIEAFFSNLTC